MLCREECNGHSEVVVDKVEQLSSAGQESTVAWDVRL